MKKILLLIGCAITVTSFSQAQLENPGFEGTWEDVSGAEDEPIEWSSIKTGDALAEFAPVVLFKSEDAHSGDFCVRLKNKDAFGVVANGIMTNGRIHADFDPENGNVFTDAAETKWNTAFTDRPDSLVAWVKYSPEGGDRGKIEVLLHDDSAPGIIPEAGATDHWVGKARIDIEEEYTDWTRVSAPFIYYNESTPDFVLSVISSGDSTIAVDGSELFVDDVQLIYPAPDDASIESDNKLDHQLFSSENGLTVNVTDYTDARIILYGLDGKIIYEARLNNSTTQHNISTAGTFIYQIIRNDAIATGKVVID